MDARGRVSADGTGGGRPPCARDEDDLGVVGDDSLDGDDGRVGDEGLGAHRDTPSSVAANRRESLSHSGALLDVTKAGEEPMSQSLCVKAIRVVRAA